MEDFALLFLKVNTQTRKTITLFWVTVTGTLKNTHYLYNTAILTMKQNSS